MQFFAYMIPESPAEGPDAGSSDAATRPSAVSGTPRVRVLLVEDSPDDAELAMRALKEVTPRSGLHWARDGESALAWLTTQRNNPPECILLDLKMPRLDGFEVLKRLKADAGIRSIPVLVMVSTTEGPDIERALALGAKGSLMKPVNADHLLRALSRTVLSAGE